MQGFQAAFGSAHEQSNNEAAAQLAYIDALLARLAASINSVGLAMR